MYVVPSGKLEELPWLRIFSPLRLLFYANITDRSVRQGGLIPLGRNVGLRRLGLRGQRHVWRIDLWGLWVWRWVLRNSWHIQLWGIGSWLRNWRLWWGRLRRISSILSYRVTGESAFVSGHNCSHRLTLGCFARWTWVLGARACWSLFSTHGVDVLSVLRYVEFRGGDKKRNEKGVWKKLEEAVRQ